MAIVNSKPGSQAEHSPVDELQAEQLGQGWQADVPPEEKNPLWQGLQLPEDSSNPLEQEVQAPFDAEQDAQEDEHDWQGR